MRGGWYDDDAVEALLGGRAVAGLESLSLPEMMVPDALAELVERLAAPRLSRLRLPGVLTDAAARALAAGWGGRLDRLDLDHPGQRSRTFSRGPTDTFLREARWPRLRRLVLRNVCDGPAAAALAGNGDLGPLDSFEVAGTSDMALPTAAALAAFAVAPALRRLRSLAVSATRDPDAVLAWAATLPGLGHLSLDIRGVSPTGLAALPGSPASQSLRRLQLGNIGLSAEMADVLAREPWPNLAELIVGDEPSDPAAVATLLTHPHFARLRSLSLHSDASCWGTVLPALAASGGRLRRFRLHAPADDSILNSLLDVPEVAALGQLALPGRTHIAARTRSRFHKLLGVPLTWDS